jgi:two-component system phosphate regulon sensor histidine kinase PhoR
LLEGALEDKENARDFVKIVHSDAERLASLISDLLDLSKIESGQLKLNLRPCSTATIVRRVVSGLARQARSKKITIHTSIPDDTADVLADENYLAQVILNLVDNAIKYSEEGSSVTVSTAETDGFVRLDVSDTGVGIPQKDLFRVFERFYRVDKARSGEMGGTGLGLSIVKHIVQAHGGEVSVESVLGQGATFSFTIPKAR